MLCTDLSWLLSWKDYWYATVSALLGSAIGIGFTVWMFNRQLEKEKLRCVDRLKKCVEFNLELLGNAQNQLSADVNRSFPNFPFDTNQFNHWLTQSYDILDEDLFKRLNWQRYQLDHVSYKILVGSTLIVSIGTARRTEEQTEYLNALYAEVLRHVNTIILDLTNLVSEIPSS
ncbi:hypothetical protein CA11_15860 [Gimesia maris]|uniref:hypothetical protein n=1 Tax=Gimesia maris TaxID=122 RepID=UPI001188B00A|nr:hypothetical protein [Gimesia maris]QDU13800.1 hypothetical protein CA11_15860 [Gimesia maris]